MVVRTNRLTQITAALAVAAVTASLLAGCDTKPSKIVLGGARKDNDVVVTPPSTGGEIGAGGSVNSNVLPDKVSYDEAELAFTEKRYGDAADLFGVYTKNKPENPWGFYMLGLSSWKSGKLDEAKTGFEKSLELDPRHIKSLLNLTRVLLEQGKSDEALEKVQAGLAIDSTSADGYRLLGRVQGQLGHTEEAITAYQRSIEQDSLDAWSMNNLGHLLLDQGKVSDALPLLARATEIKPENPLFQNNLGMALELSGHNASAAKAYEAALAADSGYAKATVNLARVSQLKKEGEEEVDIASIARSLEVTIRGWRSARGAEPVSGKGSSEQ